MSQHQASAWLRWEWRAALLTIVGGLIIACAVAAYFTFRTPAPTPEQVEEARQLVGNAVLLRAEQLVCKQALASAKTFGIVPNYAGLSNPLPTTTAVTGRYVCTSKTNVAQYNIAVDLVCRDVSKARCVNLFSVTQPDGTVLYQRRS